MSHFTLCSIPWSHVRVLPHTTLDLQQKLSLVGERMLHAHGDGCCLVIANGHGERLFAWFFFFCYHQESRIEEETYFSTCSNNHKTFESTLGTPLTVAAQLWHCGFLLDVTCLMYIIKRHGGNRQYYWNVLQLWILIFLFIWSIAFCHIREDLLKD